MTAVETEISGPRFDQYDLRVCEVCMSLVANGEYNDGEDTAEVCAAGMEKKWGDLARHMCLGHSHDEDECGHVGESCPDDADCDCENYGYSTSACDGCGDSDHGDRYAVTILAPRKTA